MLVVMKFGMEIVHIIAPEVTSVSCCSQCVLGADSCPGCFLPPWVVPLQSAVSRPRKKPSPDDFLELDFMAPCVMDDIVLHREGLLEGNMCVVLVSTPVSRGLFKEACLLTLTRTLHSASQYVATFARAH